MSVAKLWLQLVTAANSTVTAVTVLFTSCRYCAQLVCASLQCNLEMGKILLEQPECNWQVRFVKQLSTNQLSHATTCNFKNSESPRCKFLFYTGSCRAPSRNRFNARIFQISPLLKEMGEINVALPCCWQASFIANVDTLSFCPE